MTGPDPADVAWYARHLAEVAIGGPAPLAGPIEISEYDPEWPRAYAREETRIRSTLGATAFRVEHAGSTAVPGLAAKPILDVVLEVMDSAAEESYVPALESVGYALRSREPDWFEHRLLRQPDPAVNLHVFTTGCVEVERMLAFRDRLRQSASDRERYAAAKRELAARDWRYTQQYADAKTSIVLEILERASQAG